MALFRKSSEKTEHATVEERLSAYLDGELSPRERNVVERHLAGCQACRWNLETLRQTVRWTKELPTVRVPRSFTIPVPARPVRAAHRGWTVPLLQGATALVAVLLFVVVAGDMMLSTFAPAPSPEPLLSREQGATEAQPPQASTEMAAEVTTEVEKRAEQVIETVTVIVEVASPAAAAKEAPATEPASLDTQVAETPTLESGMMGAMGFFSPTEEGPAMEAEAAGGEEAAAAPAAAAETEVVTYAVEATQLPEPTVAPTAAAATLAPTALAPTALASTALAPTTIAAVPQAPAVEAEQEVPRGALQEPLVTVLGVAEIVLAAAFVLLALTTIVVMLRQRRMG